MDIDCVHHSYRDARNRHVPVAHVLFNNTLEASRSKAVTRFDETEVLRHRQYNENTIIYMVRMRLYYAYHVGRRHQQNQNEVQGWHPHAPRALANEIQVLTNAVNASSASRTLNRNDLLGRDLFNRSINDPEERGRVVLDDGDDVSDDLYSVSSDDIPVPPRPRRRRSLRSRRNSQPVDDSVDEDDQVDLVPFPDIPIRSQTDDGNNHNGDKRGGE